MVKLTVFVRQGASLRRIDEVARELAAAGFAVTAVLSALSIITGHVESRDVLAQLRAIKDVAAVRETAN